MIVYNEICKPSSLIAVYSVCRMGACLRVPEAGTLTIWGGAGQGQHFRPRCAYSKTPKPLEKAGQIGLGNEQTEIDLKQKRTC